MFSKCLVLFALFCFCYGFTLPNEGVEPINSGLIKEGEFTDSLSRVKRQKVNVDVENAGRDGKDLGTDVKIRTSGTIWQDTDKDLRLDGYADYQKRFGGNRQESAKAGVSFSW